MESMILAVLEANPQFRYLLIAMESTSFYGVHVANYLSTCDRLKPYDVKVFCLNPKTVANYRKSFTGLGKNDGDVYKRQSINCGSSSRRVFLITLPTGVILSSSEVAGMT